MAKKVVFMTGEQIGANASETIHLYRRMVSFMKSDDASVITQDLSGYPEQAEFKKVVHLGAEDDIADATLLVAKQADIFVVAACIDWITTLIYLIVKRFQKRKTMGN